MLEPDFTPLPVYYALRAAAHTPPVMYRGYHQEDHWAVTYDDDWESIRDQRAVLGGYRKASRNNARVRFTFNGTDLWLVTFPSGGQLRVAVDESPESLIHLPARADMGSVRIPLTRNLPPGRHRVVLTAEADAEGNMPTIDGWIVHNAPLRWWVQRILSYLALTGGVGGLVWLMLPVASRSRSNTNQN